MAGRLGLELALVLLELLHVLLRLNQIFVHIVAVVARLLLLIIHGILNQTLLWLRDFLTCCRIFTARLLL